MTSLPRPPIKYDPNDQAQTRAILERADSQNYKKSPSFLTSLLLSLLTVDNNVIQRKSGAIVQRTPAQLAADMPTIPVQLGAQAANSVFSGPSSGASAIAAFRALVAADISGISGLIGSGTFTPTYTSTGTPPTATYATQTGSWLRVLGICILWFDIQTATVSSVGSGTLAIGGLPFANASPCSYFATFCQNFSGSNPYVGAIAVGAQQINWRDSTFANLATSTLNTAAGNKNRLQGTIVMPIAWP